MNKSKGVQDLLCFAVLISLSNSKLSPFNGGFFLPPN